MSNFRIESYRKIPSYYGNPTAYEDYKLHVRRVLAAKGITAGFPVSSMVPDNYVQIGPMHIDLVTTQSTQPYQRATLDKIHFNNWSTFPARYPSNFK